MPANRAEHQARSVDDGGMEQRGRWYALGPRERDQLIVQLRRAGWTYKRIGRRVGMSESGVARAGQRIREGRFGTGSARA